MRVYRAEIMGKYPFTPYNTHIFDSIEEVWQKNSFLTKWKMCGVILGGGGCAQRVCVYDYIPI